MGIYVHKIINIYISSREKIKQQQIDIEDIKLQVTELPSYILHESFIYNKSSYE